MPTVNTIAECPRTYCNILGGGGGGIYCRRPTAKCDSKHISSEFYQTVVGQLFVVGVWWFLLSMFYVIFLKKDCSLLQTTGWAAGPSQHLIQ
jgi:hypothetical protein